jgi:hypothetical protein
VSTAITKSFLKENGNLNTSEFQHLPESQSDLQSLAHIPIVLSFS